MIKRDHHKAICTILNSLDADFLTKHQVGFGGGTAITLLLSEYRLSTDIDFLCATQEGYRALREVFFSPDLKRKFLGEVIETKEFRADRYAIRGRLGVKDGPSVKVEFVSEGRVDFGLMNYPIQSAPKVPVLNKVDLFAQKLLANEDRGLDRLFKSRDVIDLAFMIHAWGDIPEQAWEKVDKAYRVNEGFLQRFEQTKLMLCDLDYLYYCMDGMSIDRQFKSLILDALGIDAQKLDIDSMSYYRYRGN